MEGLTEGFFEDIDKLKTEDKAIREHINDVQIKLEKRITAADQKHQQFVDYVEQKLRENGNRHTSHSDAINKIIENAKEARAN